MPLVGAVSAIVARVVVPMPPGADQPMVAVVTPPGIRRELAGVTGFQLTVPGNAVLFGFFLALTVGMAFLEERKWGTWRRILASPVRRSTILVAKLVPYFLVGLVQFTFLFGLGVVGFGMRIGGSVAALVVLTIAVVACATALGLVFAAVGGSEKRMGSIGSVSLLVMGLLGGAMVPRAVMPPLLQSIGLAVPHAWALDGYLELLVRDGAGLPTSCRRSAPWLASPRCSRRSASPGFASSADYRSSQAVSKRSPVGVAVAGSTTIEPIDGKAPPLTGVAQIAKSPSRVMRIRALTVASAGASVPSTAPGWIVSDRSNSAEGPSAKTTPAIAFSATLCPVVNESWLSDKVRARRSGSRVAVPRRRMTSSPEPSARARLSPIRYSAST
jgi:hypothetical protein